MSEPDDLEIALKNNLEFLEAIIKAEKNTEGRVPWREAQARREARDKE
jgi:hypothetical protein